MPIYEEIESRVKAALKAGKKPLALFDVDDTIIDCRYRKYQVFKDFVSEASTQEHWPEESAKILKLDWRRLRYRVQENLDLMAIQNPEFGKALFDFWLSHYFTYPYLLKDQAFPKAQDFVRHCRALGAHIIYLTARDHARMYQGTIEALDALGFPMHSDDIHVMLKPEVSMNDHHFKVGALEEIAEMGEVVVSFENELVNLNAMAERFPAAAMYWRKTLYAPDPPAPHARVEVLAEFP